MKRRQLLMAGALVLAAGLAFFADKTPDSSSAEAVLRAPAAPRLAATKAAPVASLAMADVPIAALRPRADLMGDAGDVYFGAGKGVFLSQGWTPPAPLPKAGPAPALPPPVAPPLPFAFIGKAAAAGVWEVFLARGEQTYVVRKGTLIDAAYRVESIVPPVITLTYLPLNQVQQINIGVPD